MMEMMMMNVLEIQNIPITMAARNANVTIYRKPLAHPPAPSATIIITTITPLCVSCHLPQSAEPVRFPSS
jgi:hypothetical protein